MEHDITSVVRYLEGMARKTAKWGVTAQSTLERWTTAGIPNFGRITVGTPARQTSAASWRGPLGSLWLTPQTSLIAASAILISSG